MLLPRTSGVRGAKMVVRVGAGAGGWRVGDKALALHTSCPC
jgi:hypothetical protein